MDEGTTDESVMVPGCLRVSTDHMSNMGQRYNGTKVQRDEGTKGLRDEGRGTKGDGMSKSVSIV